MSAQIGRKVSLNGLVLTGPDYVSLEYEPVRNCSALHIYIYIYMASRALLAVHATPESWRG